ncbi:hypothetical protein [Methanobrevibacter sp.]
MNIVRCGNLPYILVFKMMSSKVNEKKVKMAFDVVIFEENYTIS